MNSNFYVNSFLKTFPICLSFLQRVPNFSTLRNRSFLFLHRFIIIFINAKKKQVKKSLFSFHLSRHINLKKKLPEGRNSFHKMNRSAKLKKTPLRFIKKKCIGKANPKTNTNRHERYIIYFMYIFVSTCSKIQPNQQIPSINPISLRSIVLFILKSMCLRA